MRQLFVMRHVEADAMKGPGGDFARVITPAGQSLAEAAKDHLSDINFAPDAVVASSSDRTRQTSEIVCRDMSAEVRFDKQLYLATEEELVRFLCDMDDAWKSVLIIGHNNGISDLVTFLSGAPCAMRTGSIAKMTCKAHPWSYSMSSCLWKLEECWHPMKTSSF